MNTHISLMQFLAKWPSMLLAALVTAVVGILPAMAATTSPPLVSISNIPLTLVSPAHPQVLLVLPPIRNPWTATFPAPS